MDITDVSQITALKATDQADVYIATVGGKKVTVPAGHRWHQYVQEALDAGMPVEEAVTPAEQAALDAGAAMAELARIDLASIRSIREYIAGKPDAPQILKDREAAAQAERAKLS